LQVQAGPHLHASPHAQRVFAGFTSGRWHPHWHAAPGQDLQEHWVELDMVCFPFDWVELAVNEMSFSSKPPPGIERSGYSRWMNRLFYPARPVDLTACADTLKGEGISEKEPRIRTDAI
jgi:hypothetical protein